MERSFSQMCVRGRMSVAWIDGDEVDLAFELSEQAGEQQLVVAQIRRLWKSSRFALRAAS